MKDRNSLYYITYSFDHVHKGLRLHQTQATMNRNCFVNLCFVSYYASFQVNKEKTHTYYRVGNYRVGLTYEATSYGHQYFVATL